jgi:RNase P/RNase MRP subunit POP5
MTDKKDDQFSEEEAQRRFDAALRGARVAGHKPKEIVTRKHSGTQRKKERQIINDREKEKGS